MIEIEIRALSDGRIQLSDMGDSLGYLHVNGLTLTRNLLDEVRQLSRRYGVLFRQYELVADDGQSAPQGENLHLLIQAALAVTDLIQRRRPLERLPFDDIVEGFLVSTSAVYDRDVMVKGQISNHLVRFYVDGSRKMLIQPLSAASESAAHSRCQRWTYRFDDIARSDPALRPFVVLDDREQRAQIWSHSALMSLNRQASIVYWSDKAVLAKALSEG